MIRLMKIADDELRITFDGELRHVFTELDVACTEENYSFPARLHEERPYGMDLKEPYISVSLCKLPEVLWRIKVFMQKLEHDFGMTVDRGVRDMMDEWKEPIPLRGMPIHIPPPRTDERKDYDVSALERKCGACPHKTKIKNGDCKLFLLMGETACEGVGENEYL